MRSISARDCAELGTGRRIASWRISLVSLRTSFVAATSAAFLVTATEACWVAGWADSVRQKATQRIAKTLRNRGNTRRRRLCLREPVWVAPKIIFFDILNLS